MSRSQSCLLKCDVRTSGTLPTVRMRFVYSSAVTNTLSGLPPPVRGTAAASGRHHHKRRKKNTRQEHLPQLFPHRHRPAHNTRPGSSPHGWLFLFATHGKFPLVRSSITQQKPARAVPLASARQHPENQKKGKPGRPFAGAHGGGPKGRGDRPWVHRPQGQSGVWSMSSVVLVRRCLRGGDLDGGRGALAAGVVGDESGLA